MVFEKPGIFFRERNVDLALVKALGAMLGVLSLYPFLVGITPLIAWGMMMVFFFVFWAVIYYSVWGILSLMKLAGLILGFVGAFILLLIASVFGGGAWD